MANSKSNVDLPDLFDDAQEPATKRFSWDDIRYYLNLLLRMRWALILPFCLSMVAGIFYALTVTPVYEASTLVLVLPPDVPSNIISNTGRPNVSENLESQISTISQQIQGRSSLEKVISEFKLFSGAESQNLFMEDKLNSLRSKIKIDLIRSRSREGSNAFSISYMDNDREKTMRIANALASNFIETNLEFREEKAVGTTAFLESELEAMREKLQETENQLSIFRNRYMGELPEQLQTNLQLLANLETQLNNRQERLRDERSRFMIAQSEVDQIRREMQSGQTVAGPSAGGRPPAGGPVTLAQLKEQLASLQGTYTELHPDVVRLKNMVAEMEAKQPVQSAVDTPRGATQAAETLQGISSPDLREAMRRRMEAEANLANIQTEVNQINQQIREYRLRIERTPQREEQLASLKRDYDRIRQAYDSLLSSKVNAEMAVSLQKKKKGEQFRVVDYAKLPEKPISPNMQLVFIGFMAAGLGIGVAIVFVREFFDHSVRKPEALQAQLSVPVLMIMPAMEHMNGRSRRVLGWLNSGLSVVGVLTSLALAGCLAAVTVLNLPQASGLLKELLQ